MILMFTAERVYSQILAAFRLDDCYVELYANLIDNTKGTAIDISLSTYCSKLPGHEHINIDKFDSYSEYNDINL